MSWEAATEFLVVIGPLGMVIGILGIYGIGKLVSKALKHRARDPEDTL